MPFNPHLVR